MRPLPPALEEGFAREGARRSADDFEVARVDPVHRRRRRRAGRGPAPPGSPSTSAGWARAARTSTTTWRCGWATRPRPRKIQALYLDGKKDEAAAAVPTKLVEELALIGPADKIRHDLEAWRESSVTSLLIAGPPETLRQAAELVLG